MTSQPPTPRNDPGRTIKQIALAMEMPFLLVGPVVVGGAIGYFLDRWLHTMPLFLLVLGVAGVVMGIVDALKIATSQDKTDRG
jgi:ATP synthase protein I